MHSLVWGQKPMWEGSGTGKQPDGMFSISMAPDRRHDNALCLWDLMQVKQRLALPADGQFTHPKSGLCRDLFDCGQVPVTAQGHHCRVIVATHPATTAKAPVGVTRDGMIYELFFTALPAAGFTA